MELQHDPSSLGKYARGARRFFNLVAPVYPLIEHGLEPSYRDALDSLALNPAWSVLDLGTGSGALALPLVERGHAVIGIDVSSTLLRRAKKRIPSAQFKLGDIHSLGDELSDSVDIVSMGFVLHGMPRPLRLRLIQQAHRIARQAVLIFDYSQSRRWSIDLVERIEGPHYFEFVRAPLSETLKDAGLTVIRRGDLASGGCFWLCRSSNLTPA